MKEEAETNPLPHPNLTYRFYLSEPKLTIRLLPAPDALEGLFDPLRGGLVGRRHLGLAAEVLVPDRLREGAQGRVLLCCRRLHLSLPSLLRQLMFGSLL
ncbi:hypothetical protein BH11PAT3_BH11PAT3_2150 [soil metagenome]